MNKSPTVSVVIPAKNEEKIIAATISRMPQDITEVIVVDNNSTDNTARAARGAGAIVLFEPRATNGIGYGFAHLRGLSTATGDFICGIDGDDTYPYDAIPKIVELMQEQNLDFVSCARLPLKSKNAISKVRQLGIKILNLEILFLYGKRVSDILSGMWVIRREILPKLNLEEGGWDFSPEIKLAALNHSQVSFAEYHIDHFERNGGASKQKIWVTGLKHFFYILRRRLTKDSLIFRQIKSLLNSEVLKKGILMRTETEGHPERTVKVRTFTLSKSAGIP